VKRNPELVRLSVFRSNKYVYAQLIDQKSGKTLAGVRSKNPKTPKPQNPKTPKPLFVERVENKRL
jgi:large subunit ribosomal protein L18